MTVFEMLGHAVGFAGVCLIFASYQFKEKRIIMIGQTLGSLCICLQFFLIGAYTAFYINCVCLTRNVVFSFGGKLGGEKFLGVFIAADDIGAFVITAVDFKNGMVPDFEF